LRGVSLVRHDSGRRRTCRPESLLHSREAARMTDADDKESVDRAFAELVAGFHLTSDRPDHEWDGPIPGHAPAPGSVFEMPAPHPPDRPPVSQAARSLPAPDPEDEVDPGPVESYEPGPAPPLPRPAWPVLA